MTSQYVSKVAMEKFGQQNHSKRNPEKPGSLSINQIYEDQDKKNLGHKREVYEIKGAEGVDLIVKGKQSDEELEALLFLAGTGVSEKLVMYDEEKLIFEKIDGGFGQDYVGELIKNSLDKIVVEEVPPNIQSNSKFRIRSSKKEYLPEDAVIKDEKVRKFYVDYVSKLLFLVLNGILHKDIKIDNIFADAEGTVSFIDFGEVSFVKQATDTESITRKGIEDLSQGLELMQQLNPSYGEVSQKVKENETIEKALGDLYARYQRDNIDLNDRSAVVTELITSGKFAHFITELGLPRELTLEIEGKLLSIISTKV